MLDQTLADTLTYHHSMIQDEARTSSFLRAILGTVGPGDVLATETIGNAGIDEGILGWVRDAKERLLTTPAVLILLVQVSYANVSRLQKASLGSDEELADRI